MLVNGERALLLHNRSTVLDAYEEGIRQLGISASMGAPDFGDAVDIREGEVPVFWACGVSTQCALESAGGAVPLALTHAPGHMCVLSLRDDELVEASSQAATE